MTIALEEALGSYSIVALVLLAKNRGSQFRSVMIALGWLGLGTKAGYTYIAILPVSQRTSTLIGISRKIGAFGKGYVIP